jgi:hypothetical protein
MLTHIPQHKVQDFHELSRGVSNVVFGEKQLEEIQQSAVAKKHQY